MICTFFRLEQKEEEGNAIPRVLLKRQLGFDGSGRDSDDNLCVGYGRNQEGLQSPIASDDTSLPITPPVLPWSDVLCLARWRAASDENQSE